VPSKIEPSPTFQNAGGHPSPFLTVQWRVPSGEGATIFNYGFKVLTLSTSDVFEFNLTGSAVAPVGEPSPNSLGLVSNDGTYDGAIDEVVSTMVTQTQFPALTTGLQYRV